MVELLRHVALLVLVVSLGGAAHADDAKITLHRVDLVPIGEALPDEDVTAVKEGLHAMYASRAGCSRSRARTSP